MNIKNDICPPLLTKYEFNQVIALRTVHLSKGAKSSMISPELKIKKNMELRQIALKEFKAGLLPYKIQRLDTFWALDAFDWTAIQYLLE